MAIRPHVVFTTATATSRDGSRKVTFGVWLDLDDINTLAFKASHNKSRKAKDGPVHVEIHSIETPTKTGGQTIELGAR